MNGVLIGKRLLAILAIAAVRVPGGAGIFGGHATKEYKSVGMIGMIDGAAFKQTGCGVAISREWVLSVSHVGGNTFVQDGKQYPIVQKVDAPNDVDLALFKLGAPVKYEAEPLLAPFKDLRGSVVKLVGYGNDAKKRKDGLGWQPVGGTSGTLRIANNVIDQDTGDRYNAGSDSNPNWRSSEALVYDLDPPNAKTPNTFGGRAVTGEGGVAGHDSGGGWFVIVDGRIGRPKLVAVSSSVGVPDGSNLPSPYCYGGLGYGVYLQPYRDWIYQVTAIPAFGVRGPISH